MSRRTINGRMSRLASSSPKDFEFECFIFQDENPYPFWWSLKRLWSWFRAIPHNTFWNGLICVQVLIGIVFMMLDIKQHSIAPVILMLDTLYNVLYGLHILAMIYDYRQSEFIKKTIVKKVRLLVDFLTYAHYAASWIWGSSSSVFLFRLACYYVRLHRPLQYIWTLNEYNMKGRLLATTLVHLYILGVTRLTFTMVLMFYGLHKGFMPLSGDYMHEYMADTKSTELLKSRAGRFFYFYYIINKIFIPIGPDLWPENNAERLIFVMVTITGTMLVSGAAVASLALVIALYMRPEESFKARFQLIKDEMVSTKMPMELRLKVETFYRMYWIKQKAVSVTQLLPIFPPTVPASIYTDIYFEAHQKSLILRDLSYHFLWEMSKVMSTIHYIPGDAIIKRNSNKSNIIFIAYGDIELLTAEDDETPLLRMTRGSVISSCGGCTVLACVPSYVQIRAATFCIAHVLSAADMWRVAAKYGKLNGQTFLMLSAFEEHISKVRKHYHCREKLPVRYRSSILQFKRNILALKEAVDSKGRKLLPRQDYFLLVAGCYIMRNVTDLTLTEESDDICLRPMFPCIFQPQSSLLFTWNLFVASLIFIVCLMYPYNIIFLGDRSLSFRFFDYVVTVIYVLDLFVALSVGNDVEEGEPITFFQTSSKQIANPWFLIDVVATLPILNFIGNGRFTSINKLARAPKMFKMLKALEETSVYYSKVFRFMSYALLLFLTCYFVASVQQTINCFIDGHCVVRNYTNVPHWMEGEMDLENVEERVAVRFYACISLVTITCLKGYSLSESTLRTMIVITLLLEMCCAVHIFIEAVYSATIMVSTSMRDDYEASIENVKKFLVRNNVEPVLCYRFIQYLQLCWYTDKAYAITHQKRNILFDLPPHVYQEIMAIQRNKYLLCLPFMTLVDTAVLKEVAAQMTLFYTSPNEILLNTGDIINEIYIVKRGVCEVFDPDLRLSYGLLGEKGYFGLLECLLRCPAFFTVRAVTHVQVYSIARKDLLKILIIPKIKESLKYARERPEFKSISMRREPFLEYEAPPLPTNRQKFPVPRKHIPDTAFLFPFTRLGYFSILRYVFPRFTIRPDGKYMIHYELFRALCAVCSAAIYPSYTYMVLQFPWLRILARCLDIAGYYDLIQRMLVGYYNDDGILVYHPASTAAHYLRGAFVTDLFACLPLELLEIPHMERTDARRPEKYLSLEVQQFLMLNRLMQLYRLASISEFFGGYIARRDIIVVLKALPLLLVTISVATSLVVVHSVDIYEPAVLQGEPWLIVMSDDKGGSWLMLFEDVLGFNATESPLNLQLTCTFWVVYEVITTGFNVFNPSSLDLIYVICFAMFIGQIVITYFSVLIISMRANVNQILANYQQNMKDIILFMKREKLATEITKDFRNLKTQVVIVDVYSFHKLDCLLELRLLKAFLFKAEVRDYYEHNWNKMGGLDYREVLKLCDQITLRTDAILHIYGHTFAKCPILYHCDMSLLRVLGRAVYSLYLLEDSVLIEIDDVISDLYIIDYGNIELTDLKGAYTKTVKLPKGSVFGNLDAQRTYRCTSRVVATSNAHLLQINSLTFHTIIADFPTVKVLMKKYRPKNENYIIGNETYESGMAALLKEKSGSRLSRISIPLISVTKTTKWINYMSSNSMLTQLYLITISLAVTYADAFNAGFAVNSRSLILFLYVLDCMFYIKILVYIAMPIIVTASAKPEYIQSRRKYLRGEFKFDIVSCLPLELISLAVENRWRVFAVLRLNRVFRMVTVDACLERHTERLSVNLVGVTLFSVFIWFSVFVHCCTCIWYALGKYEDYRQPESSWMHFGKYQKDLNTSNTAYNCDGNYVCAMYYVLGIFTHNAVADILPRNQSEVVFTVVLQILSLLIFMIYVGDFSNISLYQSFRSFLFYSQFLELQEFLKNNQVSKNLVKLVNRYSLHLWRESRGLQLPQFLETAPQFLKLKLMSAAYIQHLEMHPYFRFCETTFLRQLVGCLRMYTYCEGVYVVKENEITDAMYMIHKGRIVEIDEEMDDNGCGNVYKAGQSFGSTNGLVRDTPFQYSYRATMDSQVLTLQLDLWEYLLNHFTKSRYEIYKNIPGHKYSQRGHHDHEPDPFLIKRRSTVYGSYLPYTVRSGHDRLTESMTYLPDDEIMEKVSKRESLTDASMESEMTLPKSIPSGEPIEELQDAGRASISKIKKGKEEQASEVDDDDDIRQKQKQRLSFLPQLVQTDQEVRAEQRPPRRSILSGLGDKSKTSVYNDNVEADTLVLPKFIVSEDPSRSKSIDYNRESSTFYDPNEQGKLIIDNQKFKDGNILDSHPSTSKDSKDRETKVDIERSETYERSGAPGDIDVVTPVCDKASTDEVVFLRERKRTLTSLFGSATQLIPKYSLSENVVNVKPEDIHEKEVFPLKLKSTEEYEDKETSEINMAKQTAETDTMLYESDEKKVFPLERRRTVDNALESKTTEEYEDKETSEINMAEQTAETDTMLYENDEKEVFPFEGRRTVTDALESETTEEYKDTETIGIDMAEPTAAIDTMLYESGADFHRESNTIIPILEKEPTDDTDIEKPVVFLRERKKTLISLFGSATQIILKDTLSENVVDDKPDDIHEKEVFPLERRRTVDNAFESEFIEDYEDKEPSGITMAEQTAETDTMLYESDDKEVFPFEGRRTAADALESETTEEYKDTETTGIDMAEPTAAIDTMLYESGADFHRESYTITPIEPTDDTDIEKPVVFLRERKKTLTSLFGSATQIIHHSSDVIENVIDIEAKNFIPLKSSQFSVGTAKLSSDDVKITEKSKAELPSTVESETLIPKRNDLSEIAIDNNYNYMKKPSILKIMPQSPVAAKKQDIKEMSEVERNEESYKNFENEATTSGVSQPKHRKSLFFDLEDEVKKMSDLEIVEEEEFNEDFERTESLESVDKFLQKKKEKKHSVAEMSVRSSVSLLPDGLRRGRRITHVRIQGDEDEENVEQIMGQFPIVRPLHSPKRQSDQNEEQSDNKQTKK